MFSLISKKAHSYKVPPFDMLHYNIMWNRVTYDPQLGLYDTLWILVKIKGIIFHDSNTNGLSSNKEIKAVKLDRKIFKGLDSSRDTSCNTVMIFSLILKFESAGI